MTTLTKTDAARALVAHHFCQAPLEETVARLRSVQIDPLSPCGKNHDLVLQSRTPGYKVGDWQSLAYSQRAAYDGWDKQACLVSMTGWPLRRVFHAWHSGWKNDIEREHPEAIKQVLEELRHRGPLCPRDFSFQLRRDDWEGSWYGPNVTKQALKALWHAGEIMTHSRKAGQHVYDLTERIVPDELRGRPVLDEEVAIAGLLVDRAAAMGLVPFVSANEVWSMPPKRVSASRRNAIFDKLLASGELVEVDVEGLAVAATPQFIETALSTSLQSSVRFLAPLDQLMWSRKLVAHIFSFEYLWEVYVPEPKRRWGYYVLPVLFGDTFAARAELWCRNSELEIRVWHWEEGFPTPALWEPLESALRQFMSYCSATSVTAAIGVDKRLHDLVNRINSP